MICSTFNRRHFITKQSWGQLGFRWRCKTNGHWLKLWKYYYNCMLVSVHNKMALADQIIFHANYMRFSYTLLGKWWLTIQSVTHIVAQSYDLWGALREHQADIMLSHHSKIQESVSHSIIHITIWLVSIMHKAF